MEQVQEIYETHGYPGAARLYAIAKHKGIAGVKQKDVAEFVKNQETAQLHKRPTKAHQVPITTSDKEIDFQMDLIDMAKYARQNDGCHWILLVIDIFDRKVAAVPLKNKEAATTLVGLKEAFSQLGNPRRVVSDSGSEFKGAVDKFLTANSIIHYKTEPLYHPVLGVVDRMTQTLKSMIQKTITATNSVRWIDVLPQLVKNYNETPHSGIGGLSPQEASENVTEVRDLTFAKVIKSQEIRKIKLAVGNSVRVMKNKQTVGHKGYEIRYSKTVYKIKEVDKNGVWYTLDNDKKYREANLQKVRAPKAKAAENENEERKEEVPDAAREAKKLFRDEQILKFREGVSPENVRRSNRERLPSSAMQFQPGIDPNWYRI